MDKFTNSHVKKTYNNIKRSFIISLLVLVGGIALLFFGISKQDNIDEIYLDEIITDKEENKEDVASYLDVYYGPYSFAYDIDNENYHWYIVFDEKYAYIIYYDDTKLDIFDKEDLKENPVKISGISKIIPSDIREYAINAYNEMYSDKEEFIPIDQSNFEDYLGNMYLDTISEPVNVPGDVEILFGFIIITMGLLIFIVSLIAIIRYKKNIKKLSDDEIYRIDMELNNPDSFYYKSANLTLTPNYIVNTSGVFQAIRYEDLIWIFKYEFRQSGIKTTQAIKVMDKNGKLYLIAQLPCLTKAYRDIYDEIFSTIVSKNPKLIIGYSKETRKEIKERYNFKA